MNEWMNAHRSYECMNACVDDCVWSVIRSRSRLGGNLQFIYFPMGWIWFRNSCRRQLDSSSSSSSSRLRLHEEKVIKDRRHHLKTYPNCFVAKELIDWLIEHKEASDRETAIKLMQKLADRGIIHHGEWGVTVMVSGEEMVGENSTTEPPRLGWRGSEDLWRSKRKECWHTQRQENLGFKAWLNPWLSLWVWSQSGLCETLSLQDQLLESAQTFYFKLSP